MATEFITTDSWGVGIIINRAGNDANVVVDSGVLVGSTNTDAIVLTGSFHDVFVRGTVSAYGSGIRLGDSSLGDSRNALHVARDGFVQGQLNGATIMGTATVVNDGTILGNDYGLAFSTTGNEYATAITNRGLIQGGKDGIWVHGDRFARLVNEGTVEGVEHSYRGFENQDFVLNRGIMRGNIELHGSEDRYDGRGGIVEGHISGGEGGDTFLPGAGEETIYGDGGYDTLDFRSGGGLRVSLADDSGTGRAEGDRYWFIERILGSASGNDTLIGHHASEDLEGLGGADRLVGGEGADTLRGGAEADRLEGGWGNDTFAFGRPSEGGDVILDWSGIEGNNDRFALNRSRFYLSESESRLDPELFITRASDNQAQESDDRFVFRLSDRTLWYDANGKAAGGPTLLADLQDGAVVTAADFDIV